MEPFQPVPSAGAASRTPHDGAKAVDEAAFRISGLPKLPHPWPQLETAAGLRGDANRRPQGVTAAQNCSNRNGQKPRKTAALRGINPLEAAETLAFSHCTTRKPAEILVARRIAIVLKSLMGIKDFPHINKEDHHVT
jgi:hypothetical protein